MAITATGNTKLHWNYFLALEKDLERVSRFVEFHEDNLEVFSIELAHLLFAAASEVDVLAKCICEIVAPSKPCKNIDQYRVTLTDPANVPMLFDRLPVIKISVPRYGLEFKPWESWATGGNPDWWRSYNNVKHERNVFFAQATLRNALNAMGALLILNLYYYRFAQNPKVITPHFPHSIISFLSGPESTLLRFPEPYYGNPYAG